MPKIDEEDWETSEFDDEFDEKELSPEPVPEPSAPEPIQLRDLSPVLALELASGLTPPEDVFARHGIGRAEAVQLLKNDIFKKMIRQAKADWDSHENAEERIRLKARLALEELLPDHFSMAISHSTPPPARNEATKILKSLAGMDRKDGFEGTGGTGERFTVTINLGERPMTIDGGTVHDIDYADEI